MNQPIIEIDLTDAFSGSIEDKKYIAQKIDSACRTCGYFLVTGHGISLSKIEDMYTGMNTFFKLPSEEKDKSRLANTSYKRISEHTALGYSGILEENAYAYMGQKDMPNDYVEKFSLTKEIFFEDLQFPFPDNEFGKQFKEKSKIYYSEIFNLSLLIAELIAIGLDLPSNYFTNMMQDSHDSLRLLSYPKYSSTLANNQGLAPHRDGSFMTILSCKTFGIEFKDKNNEWFRPTPDINSFFVNLGDLMARFTNDTYISPIHRVILLDKERYSMAFFKRINDDTIVEPLPQFCRNIKAKYEPVVWKDLSIQRMNQMTKE